MKENPEELRTVIDFLRNSETLNETDTREKRDFFTLERKSWVDAMCVWHERHK